MSQEIAQPVILEEVLGSWVYSFLIVPIVLLALKHFALSSTVSSLSTAQKSLASKESVTKIDATQVFNIKRVEKLCNDFKHFIK